MEGEPGPLGVEVMGLEFVKSACDYIEKWHHQFDHVLKEGLPKTQAEQDVGYLIDLCRKLVAELETIREHEVTKR